MGWVPKFPQPAVQIRRSACLRESGRGIDRRGGVEFCYGFHTRTGSQPTIVYTWLCSIKWAKYYKNTKSFSPEQFLRETCCPPYADVRSKLPKHSSKEKTPFLTQFRNRSLYRTTLYLFWSRLSIWLIKNTSTNIVWPTLCKPFKVS